MSNWNDSIIEGFNKTIDLFNFVLHERAQLYGSIIAIMQSNGIDEIIVTPSELKYIGESLYLLFEPVEQGLKLKVLKQEKKEDTTNE